jgi:hypothetical protein
MKISAPDLLVIDMILFLAIGRRKLFIRVEGDEQFLGFDHPM